MSDTLKNRIGQALAEHQQRLAREAEEDAARKNAQAVRDAERTILAHASQGEHRCEVRCVYPKINSAYRIAQTTVELLNAGEWNPDQIFDGPDLAVIEHLKKEKVEFEFKFRLGSEGTMSDPGPEDSIVLVAKWE